jgi:hypothetical protein
MKAESKSNADGMNSVSLHEPEASGHESGWSSARDPVLAAGLASLLGDAAALVGRRDAGGCVRATGGSAVRLRSAPTSLPNAGELGSSAPGDGIDAGWDVPFPGGLREDDRRADVPSTPPGGGQPEPVTDGENALQEFEVEAERLDEELGARAARTAAAGRRRAHPGGKGPRRTRLPEDEDIQLDGDPAGSLPELPAILQPGDRPERLAIGYRAPSITCGPRRRSVPRRAASIGAVQARGRRSPGRALRWFVALVVLSIGVVAGLMPRSTGEAREGGQGAADAGRRGAANDVPVLRAGGEARALKPHGS